VKVVSLKRRISLRLHAEMRDRFLEQRINVKFYVKLGKYASDACAMLSDAYGGEAVKSQVALSGLNVSKVMMMMMMMMMTTTKEVVVKDFKEPMKMLKNCVICCIQIDV
jgi:hypothetical protein